MMKCDLLLVHPPAFFDIRENMDTMYWPFLSSGGSEPITPLYENFPLGFLSLKDRLSKNNISVEIINLSTIILTDQNINLTAYFKNIDAKLIGIDLHWMVHVQGALEVASFIKKTVKNTPIIFGGISSTYYAEELIRENSIDMVMRGYDTHNPMIELLHNIKNKKSILSVPNLLWKNSKNEIIDNGFHYTPSTSSCGINLDYIPKGGNGLLEFRDILTVENYGCAHNCGWCGGSRDAFKRINNISKKALIKKDLSSLEYELSTLDSTVDKTYNLYSLGAYSESKERFKEILDMVSKYPIKNLMIDQFHLTEDSVLEKMSSIKSNVTINLSPQSHDIEVSRLSGRGTYSMDEMESWIDKALNYGISSIDIYFFIGMPKQDALSIRETVKYCDHLLEKFKGKKVNAFICPMMPFLDPGCNYFEEPEKYGYKVFFKSLDKHRKAMEEPSIINRLNYETEWLTREEIVVLSYEAIIELFKIKAKHTILPKNMALSMVNKLETALYTIKEVHKHVSAGKSIKEDEELSKRVYAMNYELFFGGKAATVVNQAFPISRKIGARWFDIIPAAIKVD